MAIITLITDFGQEDPYVAAAKGVILSINPQASIIDITHSVQPHNIMQAAFLLSTIYQYFPKGTIHLAVVDPEVGTERRALLAVTPKAFFIAPDNGILSYIIDDTAPENLQAYSLTNSRYWLPAVSDTFHCRDIFAPVAAHLSWGTEPNRFGEAIESMVTFPIPRPQVTEDGMLVGHILHIDHFGNIITDIKRIHLPRGRLFTEIHGHIIDDFSHTYADEDELLALIGSSGYMEIAMNRNSAARFLGVRIGDEVKVGINKSSLKEARDRELD